MSRIEQLVRPALRRSRGGRIAFPLIGLTAACVALIAHAQVADTATTTRAVGNAPTSPQLRSDHTQRVLLADSRDTSNRTSYAIVRKGNPGITMSGDTRDAVVIEAMRRDMDSDFLWVRKDHRDWVITDPSIIARAERAWADMEPLDKKMEGLDAQMEVHDKKMEALDAQMDRLSDRQENHPELDAASERMDELGRRQEALGEKQERLGEAMANADDAERERLSRDMEALSAQQEALGKQMEAQSRVIEASNARVEENAQPMEALSRQMEEAGKPMEALGKQIDAVGKQMDQVSQQAERETLQLIDEAMAKGLAKPAPVRR